ncbi:MAG: hypothetical protein LBD38_03525, partial [Streptococcaceae bacterium]|nr:hypothetical protein [Streptococcaceae bacterium]
MRKNLLLLCPFLLGGMAAQASTITPTLHNTGGSHMAIARLNKDGSVKKLPKHRIHFHAPKFKKTAHLPSKFDPRKNLIPIRNQGEQSLCWSYAGNDLLSISKTKQFGTAPQIFSPNYTNILASYNSFWEGIPASHFVSLEDQLKQNIYNPDCISIRSLGDGGFVGMPAYYSMLGHNPALESDFATVDETGYGTNALSETPIAKSSFESIPVDQSFEITDVVNPVDAASIFIGEEVTPAQAQKSVDSIKKNIYTKGAVGYGYNGYLVQSVLKSDTPYYNPDTASLHVPTTANPLFKCSYTRQDGTVINLNIPTFQSNHDNLIVGFDDNYSKENFCENARPSQNGAFLIRNSWGEEVHDNGYFWVSYEDFFIQTGNDTSAVQLSKPSHEQVHHAANASGLFFQFDLTKENEAEKYGTAYFTNSYSASEKSSLNAVAFTSNANVQYEVYFAPTEIPIENGSLTTSNLAKFG